MASPFKFFRTYSSGIMIVMVILSMLLFTMDGLFSDPGQNLWLLGLLLGGAVFGVAGIGQGKWLQWGIGGAVLGALLGLILPSFTENGGLSTALGVISEDDMQEMEMRRAIANRFLMQATEESFGAGTARFAPLFGFNHRSNREDVVFGRMMRAEAERLGITVDPTMVKEYLARCTSDKLTKSSYLKIRNSLNYEGRPLSEQKTNEILGDEIKARMAWQMTRPRTSTLPPSPEVYWEYFRRLNVRQQLNLAALDVTEFVDDVGDPSEAEVTELFTRFKTKFPNEVEKGSPGFRLPARARIAYVELDSDTARAGLEEITDEDIQTYYDENKETPLIRRPVLPDLEPADESTEEAAKEEAAKDDATKDDATKDETEAKEEIPAAIDDTAKSDAAEASTPGETNSDEPAPAKTEAPVAAEPETPAKAESAASSEAPAEESPPQDDGSCEPFLADEDEADEPVADEPATEDKTEVSEPAKSSPADEEKRPENIPSKDDTPKAPEIPELPKLDDVEATAPPEIQYEYRTLDEELKKQIKESIEAERLREYVSVKMTAAAGQMDLLARERSKVRFGLIEQDADKYDGFGDEQQEALKELREQMRPQENEWSEELKTYAKKNGLAYSETPMISFSQFLEEEDYPIAKATEANDNPMLASQSASVAEMVFQGFNYDEQNNDAQLFLVRRAQRSSMNLEDGQSYYAYWAIDFSVSHIPEIDEDGVRDSVVLAWKKIKARELVEKRGEELAEKVRKSLAAEGDDEKGMAVVLKDETANGKDDGAALAVRVTEPFSWLRTSSASPMSFQQQPASLSTIEFGDANGGVLRKVGNEFMSSVFEDMKDEEVSVVANADLSKYFVVHVTNRFPTPEVGEDGLKERFATEGQQFGFRQSPIIGVMNRELGEPPNFEWEKNVWRRYDVDPDAEDE